MGLEHTRHRSPVNALVHILSCLAATTLAQPKVSRSTIDISCIRRFAGIDLVRGDIPDAPTILAFRHVLEQHQLGEKIVAAVREYLREQDLMLGEGTLVDATIIHVPPSTRNCKRERDPEMHSSCKGNQWFLA